MIISKPPTKPLLLGMNNPLSDDPDYDLFPYPEGSAGWRLWRMLPEGTTRSQYLRAFDRRNLLRARKWSAPAAREAAKLLLPELMERTGYVVVLGRAVRIALELPASEPLDCKWYNSGGKQYFPWIAFPHPSGRNRWYSDPKNEEAARARLAELAGLP